MNAGAAVAGGDVLLFLHADTRLPPAFDAVVDAALADPAVVGGRFDLQLDPGSPFLDLTAALINLRSRLTGIATGDQALFVRRAVFEAMGGFEDIPLMEDVAFTRALRRRGRVARLRQRVTTSSGAGSRTARCAPFCSCGGCASSIGAGCPRPSSSGATPTLVSRRRGAPCYRPGMQSDDRTTQPANCTRDRVPTASPACGGWHDCCPSCAQQTEGQWESIQSQ